MKKLFLKPPGNLLHKCLCRQTWIHRREIWEGEEEERESKRERAREREQESERERKEREG
jgi:hypothetical protein